MIVGSPGYFSWHTASAALPERMKHHRITLRLAGCGIYAWEFQHQGKRWAARVRGQTFATAATTYNQRSAQQLRRRTRGASGNVRINTHRSAAVMYVIPKIQAIRRAYPGITVDLTTKDSLLDIVSAGYETRSSS